MSANVFPETWTLAVNKSSVLVAVNKVFLKSVFKFLLCESVFIGDSVCDSLVKFCSIPEFVLIPAEQSSISFISVFSIVIISSFSCDNIVVLSLALAVPIKISRIIIKDEIISVFLFVLIKIT